MTGRTLK